MDRERLERIARRSVATVQRRAVWLGVTKALFGRITDNYSSSLVECALGSLLREISKIWKSCPDTMQIILSTWSHTVNWAAYHVCRMHEVDISH